MTIQAKTEAFNDLVDGSARAEKVVSGFRFTEGPVFSRRGYLLFSDIPAGKIYKWERGQLTTFREESNGANGLTFDHQGRLLACEARRVSRTEKNGAVTPLASEGLERPNDLVYSIDGTIYFTDPSPARVYRITPKGELRIAARDCRGPNGVALSPNQQKLYVADPRAGHVRLYDIEADGSLTAGREFAQARVDGLKTDERGNVWMASGPAIEVFSAAGEHVGSIEVPEAPSNCCWGDGFRGLYITARTSVYHIPTKVPGTRTF